MNNNIKVGDRNIQITDPNIPDHKMMLGDVDKIYAQHQKNPYQDTVGADGENSKKGRIDNFKKYLATNDKIQAPYIHVKDSGELDFGNGRHRFAVFKGMGVKKLPIAIGEQTPGNAKKYGLVSDAENVNEQNGKTKMLSYKEFLAENGS